MGGDPKDNIRARRKAHLAHTQKKRVSERREKSQPPALSRMGSARRAVKAGKKAVKGLMSSQTDFIPRTRAVKRLGISLKDFRRLCILKGIYPRPPPHNHARTSTVAYYHVKDISYLNHEPLLARFRDSKVYMKRVKRALGRHDLSSARRVYASMPALDLNHLIRERYPTFSSALGDADDALSLTALLETLPVSSRLPAVRVAAAAARMREWYAYVAAAGGLKSMFITIKGVYCTVSIQSIDVTWLAPFRFATGDTSDVDMRVIMTYFDLYDTFLSFILFKLYDDVGAAYPPPAPVDGQEDSVLDLKLTKEVHASPTSTLFKGLKFALGRESPGRLMELAIKSCGGRLTSLHSDATHVVWDRPTAPPAAGDREYLQPQWIADCINARVLLPVAPYRPGVTPPPHLSPYVDNSVGGYMPAYAAEMERAREAAQALRVDMKEPDEEEDEEGIVEDSSSDDDEGEEGEAGKAKKQQRPVKRARMEAPASQAASAATTTSAARQKKDDKMDEVQMDEDASPALAVSDATPLAVAMLSSKNKRLYDRVSAARAHVKRENDTLASKAAALAKAGTKRSRE